MRTRRLGKTDLELSRVGLGTWAIGGGWNYGWGRQDEKDSIATILESLEAGVNWIDTAPVYGMGRSERLVGKALRAWKRPVFVATKCGLAAEPGKGVRGRLRRESIRREAEDSLRRLGVERIDLYQIHWPDPPGDIERGFEALCELRKQGKIRYAGVSNFSVKQMKRVAPVGEIASLQPPYSMLRRRAEDSLFPYCREKEIGVITYSPLESGVLTDSLSRQRVRRLRADDWRKTRSPYFREPELSAVLELVETLKRIARGGGRSVCGLAVAWVLRRPEVTAAIVGARRPGQILKTACAAENPLSDSESVAVERALSGYRECLRRGKRSDG